MLGLKDLKRHQFSGKTIPFKGTYVSDAEKEKDILDKIKEVNIGKGLNL